MARIARRNVKGKTYYYLEESVKRGRKWAKESIYLGNALPDNAALLRIFQKFVTALEKKGIEGITPPFTEFITRKCAVKIDEAARNKKEFLGALSASARADFVHREKTTFITESNAIEGSTLDYDMTDRVLSGQKRIEQFQKQGVIVTGMGREEQEALNLDNCLSQYEKMLAHDVELTEDTILRLHVVLLAKIEGYEKYRGIWRPVNVMIRGSSHVFPHYNEVPGLMRELLVWYAKNKELAHPVELAAKFHTKFTSIHPFADGNGRMARLLMNYILQSGRLPFTNIPLKRRSEYMRTQAAGNEGNYKLFTLFLVNEVIKQNKKLKK